MFEATPSTVSTFTEFTPIGTALCLPVAWSLDVFQLFHTVSELAFCTVRTRLFFHVLLAELGLVELLVDVCLGRV